MNHSQPGDRWLPFGAIEVDTGFFTEEQHKTPSSCQATLSIGANYLSIISENVKKKMPSGSKDFLSF